jgi:hypothetical protein
MRRARRSAADGSLGEAVASTGSDEGMSSGGLLGRGSGSQIVAARSGFGVVVGRVARVFMAGS